MGSIASTEMTDIFDEPGAQITALLTIAHAIAENARRIDDELGPDATAAIAEDAWILAQSGSGLLEALSAGIEEFSAGKFSRNTRHQLRNYLNSVIGYSELLAENPVVHSKTDLTGIFEELISDARLLLRELDALRGERGATPSVTPSRTGRILVIDDDPANRQLLSRHLAQFGHQVQTCSSGSELMAQLAAGDFDLIFLDLTMPGIDGLRILSQLKSSEQWRAIPVIMISGINDEEEVIRCIEAGADDFLIKPINRVLLNARLNAGLERKRWHDKEEAYRQDLERSHSFIRKTFGRYVSEEIVDAVLADPNGVNLGGSKREVTILMADIRGFTSMAEKLGPEKVVRLLNIYLGTMSDIIIDHSGTIDEFIGDAILAIFGAPTELPDHADLALACALKMQAAVAGINRENRDAGLPDIEMGIALNTGEVVAGNIGSEKRIKYGVVGHTVNVTARLESFSRAGEVLASDATICAARRPVRTSYQFEITPKGVAGPLKAYNVVGVD